MTAFNTAIVTAFEDCGLGAEEIAEQHGLELTAVRAVLIQCSSKYRKQIKKAEKAATSETLAPAQNNEDQKFELVADEEFDEIRQAYKDLAFTSENDAVREKSLRWLLNEKKGRNDMVKSIKEAPQLSVNQFNFMLKEARENAKASREETTVDV